MGIRQKYSTPRPSSPRDLEAALLTGPVVQVFVMVDLSGSMTTRAQEVQMRRLEMVEFLRGDPAVLAVLLLAFGVMSGEAVAGTFATLDGAVEPPPHTPGRWSEIGGMAKCVAGAFLQADAEARAAALTVRKRYAFVVTDGIPSHEPAADTAAGFAALAEAARDLDLTVQVIGVPESNRDNLVALSHGTEPLLLSEIDIPALFAWLRDAIVVLSVPRPRPAAALAPPAVPPKV